MDISLSGRSAIVTGGSKGLGYAIAMEFARSGADVAIAARGREALDQAVKDVKAQAKGKVIGVTGDVGVPADIKKIYDEAVKAFGKVDIVVTTPARRATASSRRSRTRSGARISTRRCSPPSG